MPGGQDAGHSLAPHPPPAKWPCWSLSLVPHLDGTHLPSAQRPGLDVGAAPGSCLLTVVLLPTLSPGVPEMSFHSKTEDDAGTVGAPALTRTRRDLGFISSPSWAVLSRNSPMSRTAFCPTPGWGAFLSSGSRN